MNVQELEQLIRYVKQTSEAVGLTPSSDMVLDCATRILNNPNFNGFTSAPVVRVEQPVIRNVPATDKQKYALKKLNVPFPENITKQEAFKILKEKMG